jgi:nucleoid DNA-binding protein
VTKNHIVQAISEGAGLSQLQTKQRVQETFDTTVNTLAEIGRVEIRNVGVFEIKW